MPALQVKTGQRILSLVITIEGRDYIYEAHSPQRVAEILVSQLETLHKLSGSEFNEFGQAIYTKTIEDFKIVYAE